MAISATFELRDNNADRGAKVLGSLKDSYTVIDLDYTLTRNFDKTNRASSGVSMDFIKVTIRAAKEHATPFHEWIKNPNMLKGGIIKIFDSTGFVSSTVQDVTGGDAPLDIGVANELATDELEDSVNYAMDHGSSYGDSRGDIFDEMSKEDMISYIASKGLPVEVTDNDTDVIIRKKIRAYNDYCKNVDKKTDAELITEAKAAGFEIPEGTTQLTPDERTKYRDYLKKNNFTDSTTYDYFDQLDEIGRRDKNKAYDKLKSSTSKTISSIANAGIKSLESARSITFNNAYCVSLREHFQADPDHKGPVDSSYPWTLEIGIKPGTVLINGANIGGSTLFGDLEFEFFRV